MTVDKVSVWMGVGAMFVAVGVNYGVTVAHTNDLERRVAHVEDQQDRANDDVHDLALAQAEMRTELRLMRETVGDIDENVDTLLSRVEGAR